MSQQVILHIDMNSYFASVEQQANPLLRGKPVGVCAYLSPNGCIIASSREAKKRGVTTGMRVPEAKQICPEIVLIENDPVKYRSTTERIFSILADYSHHVEPYSIDEAFVDLTGFVKSFEEGEKRGRIIQTRIQREVGEWLRASVGISYTRWLAKFAGDIAEKGSVLVITERNLDTLLSKSKLTDAWGIGERIGARLETLGMQTLLDLKRASPTNIRQILGKMGYMLWAHVNGIDVEPLKEKEERQPKSIGHSYCLPKKTRDPRYLEGILMKLCAKTGKRLREKLLEAHGIAVSVGFVDGGGLHRVEKCSYALFDTLSIFKKAHTLIFAKSFLSNVYFLAVSVLNLVTVSKQLSIFENLEKQRNLALAIDSINEHYGEHIIFPGAMWGTERNAPDRIGFRKTLEPVWDALNARHYIIAG